MNNTNHITVDLALVGKYLSGEASPEEAIAIDDWLSVSEENRKQFEQVYFVWQQTGYQTHQPIVQQAGQRAGQQAGHRLPDKEMVWKEISSHPPIPIMTRYKYWLSAAAACLLIAIGAVVLISISRKRQPVIAGAVHLTKTAGQGVLQDTLPDHSTVIQNSASSLSYPPGFSTTKRECHLSGEAWFKIQPDPTRPFIINVGNIQVRVLGTSFNILQTDSLIETSVQTGSVMMCSVTDTIVVKAAQKGIYDIRGNRLSMAGHFSENNLGYATRILNFDNATLKEIAATIEKTYGIVIVFSDEKLKNLTMSSSFDNNTLQYVFDVIAATLNIKYRIENKTVYISAAENN